MIEVKNLYLSYTKDYNQLNNISFVVDDGQSVAIIGDKDSGKTSLLRVLVGLEKIYSGDITINNINLKKLDFKTDISVGYIPTEFAFMERKNISQNLEYPLRIRQIQRETRDIKVNNALVGYDLDIIKSKKLKDLTYFERVKVAIARIGLRNIDLLVIDDIFKKLNVNEQNEIIKLIKDLIKINSAVCVFALRDINIADKFGIDKVYYLNKGVLTLKGSKDYE